MPVSNIATRKLSSSSVKGDLFRYQGQLPKLPVPTLEETSTRYLKSIQPLLSSEQFQNLSKAVADFVAGPGKQLQSRLVDFAKDKDNWLAEWWDDYAYMSYRDPVVPYVLYFFNHKDVSNEVGKDQLLKALLIAYYTTQFLVKVETETLEPEIIKGNPYCMNAFHHMFNNLRVPASGSDITKLYVSKDHRYFVVAINNHFYKVYHHHATTDEPLSKVEIYKQLQRVVADAASKPRGPGIGVLTSLNRDEYLEVYNKVVKLPVNAALLETIFASSFVIALDAHSPVTIEEKAKTYWHGDGQNRFFDKPLEFIVAANGNSGFLGEHSRMDATPTVQLNNTVLQQIGSEDPAALIAEIDAHTTSLVDFPVAELPLQLPFDLTVEVLGDIKTSIAKFDALMATFDHEVFQWHGYGKNLIKQFKVSPDAFVQMMFQLSYYKLTGALRPTYESAATRKYLKGRTETGRSVSNEALAFVKTWSDPSASDEAKVATFQAACKQHVKYLVDAADGKGVDRHLFGLLKMLAPGEEVPAIFQDPVFKYSLSWFLLTSQVPSEHFQSWGFLQVINEGFGLAYLVNSEWLHVNISTLRGNGLRSDHMKYYLTETAGEMRDVLVRLIPAKAKL